jgi:signal transduction histidine kinase
MQPYAIALAALTIVTGFGLVLQQFTQTNPIAFLLFVPPILVTARAGGLRPSLVATLAGGLIAEYFFRLPYFTMPRTSDEFVPLSLYFVIGSGVSVLADQLARTRQGMQRREREFETLFRMSPIGIGIATDPECRNIAVNPAFADLLRIPASANASLSAPEPERPLFSVTMNGVPVSTDDLPMQMAARLGVEVKNLELDVDHPDGTRVSLYEYAVPLFDDKGAVRGAMGAFLDITERRRAEEALRNALDENARLYREAQEASRLKDDFLATLSHELRTPLNALLGWIQLLRSGQLGADPQRRALDAIERSAELQARLTADLLDVSAAMTGKLRLDQCRAAMPPLVEGIVDSLRPQAGAKGVHLQAVVEGDVPAVHVDPARMQQVVWNLVSNAIKFTPAGGYVRVRVAREADDVLVQVADSGIGISVAFLPFAFDRFRQEDAGPARAHAGLGLGLAIVKHLTELHGGRVTAESAGAGRGATFTVRLPATSPTADPTPPPGPPPAAAPGPQSR